MYSKLYQFLLLGYFLSCISVHSQVHSKSPSQESVNWFLKTLENTFAENDSLRFILLGESNHRSLEQHQIKSRLVKGLLSKGFDHLVFESDFIGLSLDSDVENLHDFWRNSPPICELFNSLPGTVKISGIDNRLHTEASRDQFWLIIDTLQLNLSRKDKEVINQIVDYRLNTPEHLSANQQKFMIDSVMEKLYWKGGNPDGLEDEIQTLRSLRSALTIYLEKEIYNGIAVRNEQMADNLLFLSRKYPDDRFIVWIANAHISKKIPPHFGVPVLRQYLDSICPGQSLSVAITSSRTGKITGKKSWIKSIQLFKGGTSLTQ